MPAQCTAWSSRDGARGQLHIIITSLPRPSNPGRSPWPPPLARQMCSVLCRRRRWRRGFHHWPARLAPCLRWPSGLRIPSQHPSVPGRTCRPLRRTCLPLDGGPGSPATGGSRLLAPPPRQPTATSGQSATGLPVDACRSGGAEGRKQSSGDWLCHLRLAQGRRIGCCTDDPPLLPRWPRPIPHQPSGRQCRVPCHRCHHPPMCLTCRTPYGDEPDPGVSMLITVP
jgi:hypothetical protein